MSDTQLSLAQVLALLADNTDGDISAQDLRNAVTSLVPDRATMYVSAAAETVIDTVNVWKKVNGTTTLLAAPAAHNWTMTDDNELTFGGQATRSVLAMCAIGMTAGANLKTYEFAFGVNGVAVVPPPGIPRKIGTGSDVGAAAIVGELEIDPTDTVELMVRNVSDDTNFTAEAFTMSLRGDIC